MVMKKQISYVFIALLSISFNLLIGCREKIDNANIKNDTTNVSYLMNRGLDYYESNDLSKALIYFNKALETDSSNLTDILLLKSTTELKLNNPQAALLDMRRAIVHNKTNPQIYLEFAKIYNAIHIPDSSYYYATEALELKSNDPNLYLYRALADYQKNKLQESLSELEKFIVLNSNNIYKGDAIRLKVFLTFITKHNKSTIDTLKKYERYFIGNNNDELTNLYNVCMCGLHKSYLEKDYELYCKKVKDIDSIIIPVFNDEIRFYMK